MFIHKDIYPQHGSVMAAMLVMLGKKVHALSVDHRSMTALIMNRRRRIRTKPVPLCPDCGAQMILIRPKEDQWWEAFWGCSLFRSLDKCRGSRKILPNGEPEGDEDDWMDHIDW